jgi:dihydrodipicolinate synthase/N-acetylneuraminate lyase
MMKSGFYTALGTPLDNDGNFLAGSFAKQIEDQIAAGASGLLVMGSMGIEACIKNSEYLKCATAGAKAVKGACPVFVGVMDTSISRVLDRAISLKGLQYDGVVATAPYYSTANQDEVVNYFTGIADKSPFPVYMYDLPGVAKVKLSMKSIDTLMKHGNIKGIKAGDIVTARLITQNPNKPKDFDLFFSGLDVFDIAYKGGITKNLDGMFACTPTIASNMYKALRNSEYEQAGKYLDDILLLRDTMLANNLMAAFTYIMNLLGYEGNFHQDYSVKFTKAQEEAIMSCLKQCKAI